MLRWRSDGFFPKRQYEVAVAVASKLCRPPGASPNTTLTATATATSYYRRMTEPTAVVRGTVNPLASISQR
jgi:hypothetical protein